MEKTIKKQKVSYKDMNTSDSIRRDDRGVLEYENGESMVLLNGFNSDSVQRVISKLPESIVFLSFVNCESADFSNVNLCDFPQLTFVNLEGTDNNFKKTQGDCFEKMMGGFFKNN